MDPADLLGTGKVGDRARDTKHAVKAARREPHRRGSVVEKLAAGFIGRRDPVEQLAVRLGIGPPGRGR